MFMFILNTDVHYWFFLGSQRTVCRLSLCCYTWMKVGRLGDVIARSSLKMKVTYIHTYIHTDHYSACWSFYLFISWTTSQFFSSLVCFGPRVQWVVLLFLLLQSKLPYLLALSPSPSLHSHHNPSHRRDDSQRSYQMNGNQDFLDIRLNKIPCLPFLVLCSCYILPLKKDTSISTVLTLRVLLSRIHLG